MGPQMNSPLYTLNDHDFVELWKFHEDRADDIKEAMFKIVTLTSGYSASILGFVLLSFVTFDPKNPIISREIAAIGAALIGLVICRYSFVAIREAEQHIQSNWDLARKYKKLMSGFLSLSTPDRSIRPLADQLRLVVWVFVFAFFLILIVASVLWFMPFLKPDGHGVVRSYSLLFPDLGGVLATIVEAVEA